MGKFLKEMRDPAVEMPFRLRAKNSNGIVNGRFSQRKNDLEINEEIEY